MKEREPSQKKEKPGPVEIAVKATLTMSKAARKVMQSLQKIIRGL